MSFELYLTNNIGPTSVGVNTFTTIVLLTLITNCNGGALLATQHTHTHTLLPHPLPHLAWRPSSFGQSKHEAGHARMVQRGGGGVTDLPPDAKLCKMQQNADGLVQLIGVATPHVPKQTPMPQPSKRRGLRAPNPNSRGHATKRGLRVLTPTQGATQQSVDLEIVPVSSIAPEGWGPKEGGNATSPLLSRGSPTKGTKSEDKTYARGHNDAPSISKYGSLVQPGAQIAALC